MAPASKPPIASLSWEGDSLEEMKSWPKPIRIDFGYSLGEMQEGRSATLDVRPMPSLGVGVFELKDSDESNWYRLMYLARVNDVIYVLDCFKKQSAKTETKDKDRVKKRLAQVKKKLMEERRHAKQEARRGAQPHHQG